MAVNKNFVVKNGLEVNSNLLIADLDSQTVGIGTTIAPHELHVVGGIGVTNLLVTGVATIANLRVTGPSTFVGVSTFVDGNVFIQKNLFVNGIDITGGSGGSIGTDLVIQRHVRAGGIVTFSDSLFVGSGLGQSTGTVGQVFQVAGVSSDAYIGGTLGIGTTNPQDLALHVVGDTRFVGVNTFQGDVVVTGNLDVTGDITYDEITGRNLNISGLATFQSLTQNRVAIVGAGDTLNDTNSLRFADNNLSQLVLGVGATVGGALTVAGEGTFTSTVGIAESIFHIGDTNTSFGFPAADTFTIDTGGDERLRVNPNGTTQFTPEGSTSNPYLSIDTSGDNVRLKAEKSSGDNGLIFITQNSGTAAERLRVTADGDVGIGTITPTGSHAVTASNEAVLAVGIATARKVFSDSLEVGGSQVISSARQLQNIASLDATTTTTIESAIANAPNTFTDLQVTGIATFKSTVNVEDLTPGRVVFVGAGDSLTDNAHLLFNSHNRLIIGGGTSIGGATTIVGSLTQSGGTATFTSNVSANSLKVTDLNDNRVVIVGASNEIEDDANFVFDGSQLILGVGATVGGALTVAGATDLNGALDVSGETNFSSGVGIADSIFHIGDDNTQIRFPDADTFTVETGGSERVRVDSDGDVGIGENSPDVRLHVTETINTAYTVDAATTDANNLLKLENPSTTANAFAGVQFRTGNGADMFFGAIQQTTNAGDFYFANQNSTNVEVMRIKSTGDVGIGTITPKGSHAVTASNTAVLAVGVVTAREYYGDGSNLSGLPQSGIGIRSDSTTIGFGVTFLDFIGPGIGTVTTDTNSGIATVDISGGGGSGSVSETDTTVSTVNPTGVGSFATANFRSASVIAQINQLNTDFQVGRYLMIHDGTTVTVIEESAVSTGSTMLGSFTGVIDGSNVELRVTLASAGVSTITTKIDTVTV